MTLLRNIRYELINVYQKEQIEYIQGQIDKIKNSVEDRQSRIAWQIVNKVSKRKSTPRTKLKAVRQEQRHMWKEHFKNLLRKSPKVTNKLITKIINNQLDIKIERFTQVVLKKNLKKENCWT